MGQCHFNFFKESGVGQLTVIVLSKYNVKVKIVNYLEDGSNKSCRAYSKDIFMS